MESNLYTYKVEVDYVYDGDTITAYSIDFGFGFKQQVKRGAGRRIRFYGINTEKRSTELGKAVTVWLKELLEGKEVFVKSHKDRTGKYGGYLFTIYVPGEWLGEVKEWVNLNQWMVENGFAEEYKL